jgi:hypothetical protein
MKSVYGSEGWTLNEVFNTVFRVDIDETGGIVEFKRVGALLAKMHHAASFEAARATELLASAEHAHESALVAMGETVRTEEEAKLKKDRLTEKQRVNLTASRIEPFAVEFRERKYEVSLWNRILESLKFAAKRLDGLIIIESVEAKMTRNGPEGPIDNKPFGSERD